MEKMSTWRFIMVVIIGVLRRAATASYINIWEGGTKVIITVVVSTYGHPSNIFETATGPGVILLRNSI